MIKEKGKRFAGCDQKAAQSRAQGDVDLALASKEPVDTYKIFDAGTFDNE